MRDVLHVASKPSGEVGRILLVTPHEVGVRVAHHAISYGLFIEEAQSGYIVAQLKRVIFQAVRDTVSESSIA